MFITPKKYFQKSREQKFAIPAFNIYNLETVLGVLRAAKKLKSPVIIAVSESNIRYAGLNAVYSTVEGIIKDIDKNLPVILHLDHGSDFNLIKDCIEVGFNSIQIDASKYKLNKNIQITKQVVEYAHKYKIFVEGELGAMQGGHGIVSGLFKGKIPLADINEIKQFIKETNIDSLAPAVGTVHGMFKNEKIDFKLLKQIRKETNKYLVLHGGSGVPVSQIKKAVKAGINKVNIGTEIKVAFTNTIRDVSIKNKNETDPRKILIPAIDKVEQVSLKVIKILNSQNKI
ncbi:class II fructose-bisphosphate aldolase family protein [Candidatus Falkowbacteria bacterium]|nr:class II fructose-bisphosphate aldolase family protein [Candidatus Falkowbacteria bacterium]